MATRPPEDTSWTEPQSGYDAYTPLTHALETESGHFQIFDDTPEHEIIRTQHRTGTFTEIQPDGTEVHKIVGHNYEIIAGDNNVLVKGICNITVEGDSILHVKGDAYSQIDGDARTVVNGDSKLTAKGKVDVLSSEDINLFAGGATGAVNIRASEIVNIHSDLNVSGSITSKQSISAVQNVTAGMWLHSIAGVQALGPITSTTSVWSPLTMGLIVKDWYGSMDMIRILYDIHIHPAPFGMTGTPIPLM
jgi:hypothetical protein